MMELWRSTEVYTDHIIVGGLRNGGKSGETSVAQCVFEQKMTLLHCRCMGLGEKRLCPGPTGCLSHVAVGSLSCFPVTLLDFKRPKLSTWPLSDFAHKVCGRSIEQAPKELTGPKVAVDVS